MSESPGLYLTWEQLNAAIAPQLGRDRFRALIKTKQEMAGFPPFRTDWGGFYWPRVKEWLDSDNKVATDAGVTHAEDGPENFDAAPRKKTGIQARPSRPPVLDREAGNARPEGISRHLRSVAGGASSGRGGH